MNDSVSEMIKLSQDEDEYLMGQKSYIKPMFGEYQLLGDSLLMHFSWKILHHHYKVKNGIRSVGYCVSGQRIDQLRQRIKLRTYPLSSKVMVLIGTNDVLRGADINTMTMHFTALMNLLRKCTKKILILTLPPIPKLCGTFRHWTLIRQYNDFLKSFEDQQNILVADICPLFTKLKSALEYDVNVNRDPKIESSYFEKKSRLRLNYRRSFEQKKPLGIGSDDSYYDNSTDSNISTVSEITSRKLSQGKENIYVDDMQDELSTTPKSSLKKLTTNRFVLKTFQSVFGKDVLNSRKKEVLVEKSKSEPAKPTEKSPRKDSPEQSDELISTESWIVESDEDFMIDHVYNSQEEIEYDLTDLSSEKKQEISGEFSKYVESSNRIEETSKRNMNYFSRRLSRTRNDKLEDTDSSSSCSDCSSPRYCSRSPGSPLESFNKNSFRRLCKRFQGTEKWEGASGNDKLIIRLASKICHLNCYQLFYRSNGGRMDMIHLNYNGLSELKNFLISNNYVSV